MSDVTTIGELLDDARHRLGAAPFAPATREAGLLLAYVLGWPESTVLAHPEEAVAALTAARFREMLERRLAGEPVAYIFGEREFYGRPFFVDPRVLTPRPETEHLVEAALGLDLPPEPLIVDLGTGSGIIAVTLALEIPGARLVATDLSLPALRVARSNVRHHRVEDRVALANVDLATALDLEGVDLVVSNPPYVDRAGAEKLSIEVTKFEPHTALFAPGAGHSVLERLLAETTGLRPGAHLIVEIGFDQNDWLTAAAAERETWKLIQLVDDYGAIPRIAVLRRAGQT